ncbi:MAG TPA: Ig domain-containing protein, partial [Bacteroidota bacterium]|nr:Ig domain-containing protein [Bacteroidota bacterium]
MNGSDGKRTASRATIRLLFLLLITVTPGALSFAQPTKSDGEIQGIPWTGGTGTSRLTSEIMTAEQGRTVAQSPRFRRALEFEVDREHLPQNPQSPDAPAATLEQIKLWMNSKRPRLPFTPQTVSTSFTGATLSGTNPTFSFPPDNMGDVGSTQYIVAVNGRIVTFSKSTGLADGVLNTSMDNFFSAVMTPPIDSNFTSDPRIRYDRSSGRWIVTIIDVPGLAGTEPNRVLLAVSDASTIAPGTVWTNFYFQQDSVAPIGNAGDFADYPTLGVDVNALYIGANMFDASGSFVNTTAFVVRKSSILGAGPIVVTAFRNLVSTVTAVGPYAPQGVDNFDASATQGYFIGVDFATFGTLILRKVSNPGGTPTISSNISLTVPATSFPATVPHLGNTGGTNGRLDAIDDRLYAAVIRNGRLWTAHNILVSNLGVATGTTTRDGIRWYEIQNLGTTPSVAQSGTVFDPTAPNDGNQRNYWMPTIMVSGQGHAALGFSTAGTSVRINAGTVGRLRNDTQGVMQIPALFTGSSTAYNPSGDPGGTGGRRWGDYSYTSLDPNDDMTMWTIQQFCDSTNSYGCRVAKLLAPVPATASAASPSTLAAGSTNTDVTVTGTSSGGSEFFDPGSGFLSHISASVSGSGITVNNVTYTNPTQVTLNIDVAAGAIPGGRTVTITNPDGQSTTGASAILTITAPGCPAIMLAPASLPEGTEGTAYNQTITASGGTAPYAFAVTSGSLPTGLSLSTGGLLAGTPTTAGTSNFTVTVTDDSNCTGSLAYALTINAVDTTLIPLSSPGVPYTQNFSTLASSGTSTVLPAGWLFSESGSNANTTYNSGNGSSNTGDTYSFGSTSSSERALGMLQSGTLAAMIGGGFRNNTGSVITSLVVAYTGEQWRLGTIGRTDRIDFQMSTDATDLTTGTYSDINNLDFSSPTTTGATGALDGNASPNRTDLSFTVTGLNIANGATFFLRWTDFNATSADDGLSIDDFSITPFGISGTDPSGVGAANPQTVTAGASTLLRVTVTPGTNPASTGLTVNGDLRPIGGPASQMFFDDGSHGDTTAGDNVFSFLATVGLNTPPGSRNIAAIIGDDQARADTALISLSATCPAISMSPPTLPGDSVGSTYSQTLSAIGGTAPYIFIVTSGSLPHGLALSPGGLISGTPTLAESVNVVITATDSNGCGGEKSYAIKITQGSIIYVTVQVNESWNMVSNPIEAQNDSVSRLFPDAVSNAFAYVPPTGYQLSSRLKNGTGYWLKFNSTHTDTLDGAPIPVDTIDVAAGWNMIGSISQRIGVVDIQTIGTTLNSVYGYDGSYHPADSIIPGHAYWINAAAAGLCVLSSSSSTARNAPATLIMKELDGLNKLTFSDMNDNSQSIYFGVRNGAVSPDHFNLPPPPPVGVFDIRFSSQRIAEL